MQGKVCEACWPFWLVRWTKISEQMVFQGLIWHTLVMPSFIYFDLSLNQHLKNTSYIQHLLYQFWMSVSDFCFSVTVSL